MIAARQLAFGGSVNKGGFPSLPSGYILKDYIKSNGSGCLVIPHTHTNPNSIKVDCSIYVVGTLTLTGKNIFQGANNDHNWMGGFYASSQNASSFYMANQGGAFAVGLFDEIENRIEFELINGTVTFTLNGRTGTLPYTFSDISLARMGIFTQTNGSSYTYGRAPTGVGISHFFYQDGDYKADLYPVIYEKTGESGMYDVVNDVFITDATASGGLSSMDF